MKCEVCGDSNSKMRISSLSPYVSEGLLLCDKCHEKGIVPYTKMLNFISIYDNLSDMPEEVREQVKKIISYYGVTEDKLKFDVAFRQKFF